MRPFICLCPPPALALALPAPSGTTAARSARPLALEFPHVGDNRPPIRGRIGQRYPAISPMPFVMTSKICPSG
jgi:hypothetical protein